jgi:hypothetical protein
VGGAKSALLTPRFFQSVGRAMTFADDQLNAGANRDRIRIAFQKHNILLGANAMSAPAAILAGTAPSKGRAASLGAATRRDLLARLGAGRGARLSVETAEVSGQRFTRAVHTQRAARPLDKRLKGVTAAAQMPVLVGDSGGKAALVGHLPEPISTARSGVRQVALEARSHRVRGAEECGREAGGGDQTQRQYAGDAGDASDQNRWRQEGARAYSLPLPLRVSAWAAGDRSC